MLSKFREAAFGGFPERPRRLVLWLTLDGQRKSRFQISATLGCDRFLHRWNAQIGGAGPQPASGPLIAPGACRRPARRGGDGRAGCRGRAIGRPGASLTPAASGRSTPRTSRPGDAPPPCRAAQSEPPCGSSKAPRPCPRSSRGTAPAADTGEPRHRHRPRAGAPSEGGPCGPLSKGRRRTDRRCARATPRSRIAPQPARARRPRGRSGRAREARGRACIACANRSGRGPPRDREETGPARAAPPRSPAPLAGEGRERTDSPRPEAEGEAGPKAGGRGRAGSSSTWRKR